MQSFRNNGDGCRRRDVTDSSDDREGSIIISDGNQLRSRVSCDVTLHYYLAQRLIAPEIRLT